MAINVDQLNEAINAELKSYNETIVKGVKKYTVKAMKELVNTTKATAPVGNRSKHYKDSITSKTLEENSNGVTKVWYVKGSDYRLSHLLNNGHALRDGGRYPGTNFIGNAVDTIVPKYVKEIEEVIKNG